MRVDGCSVPPSFAKVGTQGVADRLRAPARDWPSHRMRCRAEYYPKGGTQRLVEPKHGMRRDSREECLGSGAVKPMFRDRGCGDRKSTRLNSSHLGISYAVFCL